MKQFLETIRILDGVPQHLNWHQQRVDATMKHFYPVHRHSWTLASCIIVPGEFKSGAVRCRVVYDAHLFTIHYFHYEPRFVQSLKLIEAPPVFDYWYKYEDRYKIEDLFQQRGDCDDILMTREGWITDTSIANIALEKGGRWYTPSIPLLAGTTWKRLVASGILIVCPIHFTMLGGYDSFRVFNSMNDWLDTKTISTRHIMEW
jgi:4-amino-4-deoxychorismate lyase